MPNIVYILADDMGLGEVRAYTPTSPVATPNIDRLANEGMRFTNARTSSSVCSPTRYALLTGRYGWRGPLPGNVVGAHRPAVVEPARLTVAEMLQQNGYDTALIGKWHLGLNWVTTDGGPAQSTGTNVDYSQPFTGGPLDHGFNSYYGDDVINWPPYTMIRDDRTIGIPVGNNGQPFTPPGGSLPGLVTPGYSTANTLPAILDEVDSYIGAKANQAAPFFLNFWLTAPHYPIVPPPGVPGTPTGRGAYGDFVAAVDWSVGRVLHALEDPNNDGDTADSVLDSTIVVFAADNGTEKLFSSPAIPDPAGIVNGQPLRGQKATVWEGGFRVPMIVRWNGEVAPGSVATQMVEVQDFMATMADIIGYSLPTNAAEDSFSLAPLLRGESMAPVRKAGIQNSAAAAKVIRQVDSNGTEWELIFCTNDCAASGAINPFNTISNFGALQLYNLTTDPGESTNLLAGGGTPQMQEKALQLQALLQQLMNAGRTAPTKANGDFNGDHAIDVDDFLAWRTSFGSTSLLDADANGNGIVDTGDYIVWRKNYIGLPFTGSASNIPTSVTVPEPATALSAGLGALAGYVLTERRRHPCRRIRVRCR